VSAVLGRLGVMNVKKIELPFFDSNIELRIPDTWEIQICTPKALPTLSDDQLGKCFAEPIGTRRLREIAVGKRTAAVVVEDVTRPMRVDRLVPIVLRELEAGGIARENIVIMSAVGCHKPQTGPDFRRKLGNHIVDNYRTVSPSQHDQLTYVGTTRRGTPIHVNAQFASADVKVGVGGILPHPAAGYGGGGKTVMPGVCGAETIATHHLKGMNTGSGVRCIEGNEFRADLEEAAELTRLDFVVNAIMGVSRDIVGLFVGDMIEAHRQGIALAEQAYAVTAERNVDINIISAYPEDYDLIQSTKALAKGMGTDSLRVGGTVLLVAACPDGAGHHSLYGPTGKGHDGFLERRKAQLANMELVIYSPGVGPMEMLDVFPGSVRIFRDADAAVDYVAAGSASAKVNVFPYGAISLLRC
jgi:nickel-dependent lactate racemase